MKRITTIQLQNYRAFYGQYAPIQLPNGQNLLIYGENGSGKSSLFKALSNFFTSSRNNTLNFATNHHNAIADGSLQLTFSDIDTATNSIVANTDTNLTFGTTGSNNDIPFVRNTDLIKGFLNYRSLLEVYLHKEPNPNLFDLIFKNLLYDFVPTGVTYKIGEKWVQLQKDLIDNSYTRNNVEHKLALAEMPSYYDTVTTTLTEIFEELNNLLATYFSDLSVTLNYNLQPFNFNYGYKWEWHTTADFRLIVSHYGIGLSDYSDVLNEARLSAVAICLYLAALKRNPMFGFDYKILFLDDVFVGLDAGNRIPILNILNYEFADYQIFISTYDRHWFEIAKRQFNMQSPYQWLSYEFYVGTENNGTREFDVPIIVKGTTNYEKGVQYLHNRERPDYPAAANYFRKALEDTVQKIPKCETTDANKAQILDYKLTKLTEIARTFLYKTNNPTKYIDSIIPLLPALLHPLSHHEITAPVYKSELLLIETNIPKLKQQLENLDIENNYKCLFEVGQRFKITFEIDNATKHYSYYEILLREPLLKINSSTNNYTFSFSSCVADKTYGVNGGTKIPPHSFKRSDSKHHYSSLGDAYEKIYSYMIAQTKFSTIVKAANYTDAIEVFKGNEWMPLADELNNW